MNIDLINKGLIYSTAIFFTGVTGCKTEVKHNSKPNFIIIQLDDLGYSDLGIHGNSNIETPYIDQLAEKSVQFTNFYVNPVCAPTRASLLTGRHFLKTGVSHVHGGKDHLNLNEKTFADIFRRVGYATGIWGKWHSGTADGYLPWQRGFDEAYMARLYVHRNSYGEMNGEPVETNKWADNAICDYTLEFIKNNRNKPFLAYLSFLTVHSPLDARDEYIQKYRQKGLSENLSILYAMIDQLDQTLGNFFSELEDLDIYENTVVLFMSDNGPAIENGTLTDNDRRIRYVNNLRGHKGNIWENGITSPLFLYQKGKYEKMKLNHLTDVTDIMPTMMEMAGIKPASDDLPLDGISFLSLLENPDSERLKVSFNYANQGWPPTDKPWTPEGVMDEYRPLTDSTKQKIIIADQIITARKGKFKLLQNPALYPGSPKITNSFVLIDIQKDPEESNNVTGQHPDEFSELKDQLQNWFKEIKASPHSFAMPVFEIHSDHQNLIFAKAPAEISRDLKNAFNYLGGWKTGSIARYHIIVQEDTDMTIELEFLDQIPLNTQFTIRQNDREILKYSTDDNENRIIRLEKGRSSLILECEHTIMDEFALKNIKLNPL